jgi:hypothetical protein
MLPSYHLDEQVGIVGRPDLERATHEETSDLNMLGLEQLLDQQAADEKPTQDEKQVHADPAAPLEEPFESHSERVVGRNGLEVKLHDRQNCEAAHEIELVYPLDARRLDA